MMKYSSISWPGIGIVVGFIFGPILLSLITYARDYALFRSMMGDGQYGFVYFFSAWPFGAVLGSGTLAIIGLAATGKKQDAAQVAIWFGAIMSIVALLWSMLLNSVLCYGMLPLIWAALLVYYGLQNKLKMRSGN